MQACVLHGSSAHQLVHAVPLLAASGCAALGGALRELASEQGARAVLWAFREPVVPVAVPETVVDPKAKGGKAAPAAAKNPAAAGGGAGAKKPAGKGGAPTEVPPPPLEDDVPLPLAAVAVPPELPAELAEVMAQVGD